MKETRKEKAGPIPFFLARWLPKFTPQLLASASFVAGAILLLSGVIPSEGARLAWLQRIIPLPVIEISHFLGSITGMVLLLLARGLQRRLDAAYFLALFLLLGGILFSLLKGLDYEEAFLLSLMLAALLPARRYFYRKALLTAESFSPGWTVAILVVVVTSIWLGLFSYKHVGYSQDLWWRFTLFETAPRFLRATVGIISVALFFAVASLLRPARVGFISPHPSDLDRVREIVKRSNRLSANLALLGDKSFFFSRSESAFLMYGIHGRSWVALGDPVGPEEEWRELVWKFRKLSDLYDAWTVFSEIGKDHLPLYLDLGLTLLKMGEEARVPLAVFSLEGSAQKEFRRILRRFEMERCTFDIVPPTQAGSFLGELKIISDDWLSRKRTREKGFSLGSFKEDYLREFPLAVVKRGGKIVAFANLWLGLEKMEMSLDLMRYLSTAPLEIMDYLFIQLMLWGKKEGYQTFNLGLAPFAGFEDGMLAPVWSRIGALIYRYGEHFYNFEGLRRFKDKFDPVWEPKYLASPAGLALPRILADIAALNSGGFRGIFTK